MITQRATNFLLLFLIVIVIFFGIFYNNKLNTIEKEIMDNVQNYTITTLENHNDAIEEKFNIFTQMNEERFKNSNLIIEQNFKNYNEMFQRLANDLMKKQNEN
jgi:succinate dehydrogenase hydrophobic anchor subunit